MSDYEAVRAQYSGHPHVQVEPLGPRPPEGYRITFKLRGLVLQGDIPVPTDVHECEIRFPLGYPREQPYCVPLTPIFHPNVDGHYCIADYWSAGEPLVDVIAKLGDMIQYRIYNTKSPLNATAAYWAEQHPEVLPVGAVSLGAPDLEIQLGRADSPRVPDNGVLAAVGSPSEAPADDLLISIKPRGDAGE